MKTRTEARWAKIESSVKQVREKHPNGNFVVISSARGGFEVLSLPTPFNYSLIEALNVSNAINDKIIAEKDKTHLKDLVLMTLNLIFNNKFLSSISDRNIVTVALWQLISYFYDTDSAEIFEEHGIVFVDLNYNGTKK